MEQEQRYKELLKNLEKMKESITFGMNELGQNDQAIRRTTVYPMAKVQPLMVDGYPVFQFGYEGLIPTFKEDDYEYLSMIRNYYFRATYDSYDYSKLELPVMSEVALIFIQYFKDMKIRELGNRNKKYIQDAIRQTRIFGDDHWRNVWNIDIGFLAFLMLHHEKLKDNMSFLPTKSEYEAYYLKEKKQEKADKTGKKKYIDSRHFY